MIRIATTVSWESLPRHGSLAVVDDPELQQAINRFRSTYRPILFRWCTHGMERLLQLVRIGISCEKGDPQN